MYIVYEYLFNNPPSHISDYATGNNIFTKPLTYYVLLLILLYYWESEKTNYIYYMARFIRLFANHSCNVTEVNRRTWILRYNIRSRLVKF